MKYTEAGNSINLWRKEMRYKMIRAFIFDLDGTIGNTLPLCIAAFRKAIKPLLGRNISDQEIVATFGPSEEGTIRALIPDQYEKALTDYLQYYQELHEMCPEPFDGMLEIFEYLQSKDVILAMVTGKGEKSTAITLSQYGLESLFAAVETGSPSGPRKPEGIKNVLRKLNLKPGETIYVGDAPGDIIAARAANVLAVSAAWANTANIQQLKELHPDEIFFTVAEFKAYLMDTLALKLA